MLLDELESGKVFYFASVFPRSPMAQVIQKRLPGIVLILQMSAGLSHIVMNMEI